MKVGDCVLELNIFDHERAHLLSEFCYPSEELVWVIERLWDLLEELDKLHDIWAADLSDLATSKCKYLL